jgi:hypothetical protein
LLQTYETAIAELRAMGDAGVDAVDLGSGGAVVHRVAENAVEGELAGANVANHTVDDRAGR